ncbi:hypothetical protein CDV57_06183 [Aspergillus fumigatus]|nr:hypothetical protein CDV57_06183 [Aspergillus fumigatus]
MDLFAHCWPSLTTKVFPLFCFALCTVTAALESPQNSDSIGKLSTNVCNILAGVSGYTQVRIEILNNGLTETYTWSTTLAEGCEAYLGKVLTACQTESSSTSCNEIHLSFGRSSSSTTISLQSVNSAEIESRTIATVPSMTIASKETESTSAQQVTEEHQTPPASRTSDSQKATQGSKTSSDAPTPSSTSPKSAPCLESQAADTPSSSLPSATSAAPYCVINHSAFVVDENRDKSDEEPLLCLAAAWKRSEMVQLLLDHGWNVNDEDAEELTPLLLAAKEGYSSVVQVLLNHPQINLHAQDHCGSTALHAAAKEGHLEVVKLLLTEGSIDVNVKDKDGLERPFPDRSTSLHRAVQARDVRIMSLLLTKEDLDPNVADHQKWTPLCWAASQGDVEMVDLLLTRPEIRINGVEGEEVPPLCLAALTWTRDGVPTCHRFWLPSPQAIPTYIAMELLASGKQLNVNIQTYAKVSALSLAARHGDLQVVNSILCDTRTDRNSVDDWGRTALWLAAHTGKSVVVERFLLDDNIQVDIGDDDGIDALNAASKRYHFDTVKLLRTHRPEHHHGVGGSRPLMASN